MKYQAITIKQTYIVSIEPNEDIVDALTAFVQEKKLQSGYLIGIGAVKMIRFGHYSVKDKKYTERKMKKPLELSTITGIVTQGHVHVHATVGSALFRAYAGHLSHATVAAACEIIVVETKEKVTRKRSEEIGLDLIDL